MHDGIDFINPAALENCADCGIGRKDIGWVAFESGGAAAAETLERMFAFQAFRVVGEHLGGSGVDQAHVAGIGEACGKADLRDEGEFLLDIHAAQRHAGQRAALGGDVHDHAGVAADAGFGGIGTVFQ